MQHSPTIKIVPSTAAPKSSVVPLHDGPLVLDPKASFDIAREFVRRHHLDGSTRTLRHHNGVFYAWSGRHYAEVDEARLRTEVYAFLDSAERAGDGRVRFKPKMSHVNEVLDAVKALTNLDSSYQAPVWLGDAPVPANEIVACRNGLLHLPTGQLYPHTPEFFCHNALDFDFDPVALAPIHWLKFVSDLWFDDPESVATLQEIFGLCLTSDTRYQKAFMLIGPRRSGKGTIARVLKELIGRDSWVAPTLSSMAEHFGPASLIGKRVACISDARINKRTNLDKLSKRLLSITGEDTQTIDRKYLPAWTGTLQVRFIVLTNELPELDESSLALVGRFIIVRLLRSFYGCEDLELSNKLLSELPGILNWSIAGWRRLATRGHFVQPKSGMALVDELENLSSPIMAFVKDCCVVAPEESIECGRLYEQWCQWNEDNERPNLLPTNLFGRDLHAAVPRLSTGQRRVNGKEVRVYIGIGLYH
jgi:putative DNA primase/helicase